MAKKYTPDAKGVAKWLIDNPTKKNKRGRSVPTTIIDGYKGANYPPNAPRLNPKEGNLTNNREALRFSPRKPGGARGVRLTKQDYLDHPRYADDPNLARQAFDLKNTGLNRVSRHSSSKFNGDHFQARNGANKDTVQSFEHPHNKGLAFSGDNGTKGNKELSNGARKHLGIGTTKAEMIDLGASSPLTSDGKRQTPRYKRQVIADDLGISYTKGMGADNFSGGKFKYTGGLRQADAVANIGANLATGNATGAVVNGSILAGTAALQNTQVQKRLATEVSKLVAQRGAKTASKLVPGLDVVLSAGETMDYLKQGKLDQAGIALVSGIVGFFPGIGDAVAAGLDASNTAIDISRLDIPDRQPEVEFKGGKAVYKKPRISL